MDELIHRRVPSPNFNMRKLPITMVVMHYTDMLEGEALPRLTDPEFEVSAHYFIERDGTVVSLVDEDKRAWHAGASSWRDITDVNSASIGIEMDNPGHGNGYVPFPQVQIDALLPLLARIVSEHDIPRANVVAHSDIAPARKVDPGELFPWHDLAKLGLCLPRPTKLELNHPIDNDGAFFLGMERFGYNISDREKAVEAFQRRWRPELIDGIVDGEIRAILFKLLLDRDQGLTR